MNFSKFLKDIRKHNHFTQSDLATQLRVSRSAVAKWESNRGLPDIDTIIKISKLYCISLDDLLLNSSNLQRKIIKDSKFKYWHYLIIAHLIASLVYITFLFLNYHLLLLGYAISVCFGNRVIYLLKSKNVIYA